MTRFARTLTAAACVAAGVACAMACVPTAQAQGAKKGTIEIRQDRRMQYRFFYLSGDGKTLAMCPRGYDTVAEARKAISEVKQLLGKGKKGAAVARDRRERFRFSVKDAEGKTLAMSAGRGYATEKEVMAAADAFKAIATTATPTVKKE